MTDLLTINEDERRKLTAFPEGKMLEIKEDCIVGGHYHMIKTELFVLIKGQCKMTANNITAKMEKGVLYEIVPTVYHSFEIKAGSILIGLCSHSYDPKDDYHL